MRQQIARYIRYLLWTSTMLLPWSCSSAYAQTLKSWNGGSGAWGVAENWSPNGTPNSIGDEAVINGLGSNVTLGSDATVGRASIGNGASLAFNPGQWFTLYQGAFAGSGALQVDGNFLMSSGSELRLHAAASSTFSLLGGGTLNLGNGTIKHVFGTHSLTNGVTIAGAGNIEVGSLTKSGLITATGPSGITISTTSFLNSGQILANASSKVSFSGGSIINTGHSMIADGVGAKVFFGSSVTNLRGGTLQGINGGEIYVQSDSIVFDGQTDGAITLVGQTRIADNYWPYFRGQIVNDGTITTGGSSQFRIASGDTATLDSTGGGQLQLNNATISGNGSLVNSTNHTITGTGHINTNTTNNGVIRAQGGTLSLNVNGVTNYGQMTAAANSQLRLAGANVINHSTISADGTGSQVYIYSNANIHGGTLQGINGGEVYIESDSTVLDGETNGALNLAGNIRVANNYWPFVRGTINNTGTISLGPSSQLRVSAGQSATIGSNSYTGQLVLDNSIIQGYAGVGQFTNGPGNTIRGTGYIGNNTLNLKNEGTILAQSGQTIQINPESTFTNFGWPATVFADGGTINFNSGNITNHEDYWIGGYFKASNGGTINLLGSAVLTNYSAGVLSGGGYIVDGTGQLNLGIGNITTLDRAHVKLSGASSTFSPIQTLATNNGGVFEITNGRNFTTVGGYSSLAGVTTIGSGSTMAINGALDNAGRMEVHEGGTLIATAGPIAQYNSSSHSLTGGAWHIGGTAHMAVGAINELNGGNLYLTSNSAQVLQSDGSNALSGFNRVGAGSTFGISNGVSYTGPSNLTNQGRVEIGDGWSNSIATLSVPGTYTQASGATILDSGHLIASSGVSIDGGVLGGNGTIDVGVGGTVTVDGQLDAWNHIFDTSGTIHFDGNLILESGATYLWSLASANDNLTLTAGSDSSWDMMQVSGNVLANGATFQFYNWGYGLGPNSDIAFWHTNHSWDVMTGNTINNGFHLSQSDFNYGTFSLNVLSNGSGQSLKLMYNITAVPEPSSLLLVGLMSTCLFIRRRQCA